MKFIISIVVLLLHTSRAMTYGKVFPTRFPLNTVSGTQRLIVKNVSEISEFSELVHEEDDTRRILELREGIAIAKEKEMPRFTFRCICGTKYSDVFSTE
jgi:hypothetical protein